jgi:hypothetical protein
MISIINIINTSAITAENLYFKYHSCKVFDLINLIFDKNIINKYVIIHAFYNGR